MKRSWASLAVSALSGLLVVVGVVFFVYTLFVHVDLAEVRTGPLVLYSLLAVAVAALLILIQIPVVVFVLVCRPGIRLRVVATFVAGIVVFFAGFMLGGDWVERQLPPREGRLGTLSRACAQSCAARTLQIQEPAQTASMRARPETATAQLVPIPPDKVLALARPA